MVRRFKSSDAPCKGPTLETSGFESQLLNCKSYSPYTTPSLTKSNGFFRNQSFLFRASLSHPQGCNFYLLPSLVLDVKSKSKNKNKNKKIKNRKKTFYLE